jgi:hypothetical protein
MFTGNEDQFISLTTACGLTAAYRSANPGQTLGFYFSKKTLEDILAQEGCVGVRFYNGRNSNGEQEPIAVGVNSSENDLYEGLIGDKAPRTPPGGASNPLNS